MNKKSIIACGLAALMLLGSTTPIYAAAETVAATAQQTAGIDLADGVYIAEFITDSSMFHANETCDGKGVLSVKNGQAVFHVSLVSKTIQNLYLGLAADAVNDEENWLQPTTDSITYADGFTETVYGFDIPVSAIGEDFDLALIGKKGKWYDHKVSVANPTMLADGEYTCEVTLSGGSGRTTVESPAKITVADGVVTATIRWSSSKYEYMLVDDVKYMPIQTEGNSTFEIPVVLDTDLAVSGSNIAMSQPHLIDYTLHFAGASLTEVTE